jgi:hypothetical protein
MAGKAKAAIALFFPLIAVAVGTVFMGPTMRAFFLIETFHVHAGCLWQSADDHRSDSIAFHFSINYP